MASDVAVVCDALGVRGYVRLAPKTEMIHTHSQVAVVLRAVAASATLAFCVQG